MLIAVEGTEVDSKTVYEIRRDTGATLHQAILIAYCEKTGLRATLPQRYITLPRNVFGISFKDGAVEIFEPGLWSHDNFWDKGVPYNQFSSIFVDL